jgi:hypothetical protein
LRAGSERQRRLRRIFGIPLLLAVATVIGLFAALVGQGVWHLLAWILLSIPIAVAARYLLGAPRGARAKGEGA